MFILDKYHSDLSPKYTNDEYLAQQVWMIENIFRDTPGAIKDINLNYIAMTDAYYTEFELELSQEESHQLILNQAHPLFSDTIRKHEEQVIQNLEVQDSVFIFKPSYAKSSLCYGTRKRPIINPSTNEVLGIFIASKQQQIGSFRTQFLAHMLGLNKNNDIQLSDTTLNDEQQRVAICLLYGYHSRQEIAEIISENSSQKPNTIKIKNLLSSLYDKFECSTTTQLLQEIARTPVDIDFIMDSIEDGNHLL